MILVQKEWYTVEECITHPKNIYIFGDNMLRRGTAGQAVVRLCSNSYGIITKKSPSMDEKAFFDDSQECFDILMFDLNTLKENINSLIYKDYDFIFPRDGLGTGLSQMPKRSPVAYQMLCDFLKVNFNINTDSDGRLII